ncbi:MAG: hypothetical protein COX36_03815 [Candidatus Nealsonbacteria bacterium CG23_combo_of_CG06-09_8_20_14_all_38_19]|uniref:Transcriptional regulator n=2 Tax=Candidatus Nealsoniibacteriota TaxID=1817911 RepID=A0A2G9YXA6_9BACT|nr:MAG: hypothetical protein COX36_03815 [Candidatus Nealsonbacteria bacterium CG23_combo_of_CG06-09_8_20_14_all_38_19]
MKYKVPFVNFPEQYRRMKPEIDQAVLSCFEGGNFILGEDLASFETNLADYVGTKYAVGVGCGTDALFLSLRALGIREGDEVITVSETFIATISVVVNIGALPILIDVKEDMLMDVDKIEEVLNSKTKAIIPVHLAGAMCDMEKIMSTARKNNLFVIEDACQGLGAEQKGRKAGSFGDVGCFSFHPAKILGAAGNGGSIVTNNEKIADEVKLLRDAGRASKTEIVRHGYNSTLDNLQAAILNVKLKYLSQDIEKRKKLAEIYNNELKDISQVRLPNSQTYQDYILRAENRDKLAEHLLKEGVEVLVREIIPNHKQPGLGLEHFNLPITEKITREKMRLPICSELKEEQVYYAAKKIKEFYFERSEKQGS